MFCWVFCGFVLIHYEIDTSCCHFQYQEILLFFGFPIMSMLYAYYHRHIINSLEDYAYYNYLLENLWFFCFLKRLSHTLFERQCPTNISVAVTSNFMSSNLVILYSKLLSHIISIFAGNNVSWIKSYLPLVSNIYVVEKSLGIWFKSISNRSRRLKIKNRLTENAKKNLVA